MRGWARKERRNQAVHVLIVEPYCTGSHSSWVEGLARHSAHSVKALTLPGRFWKWRMHGGAVTLGRKLLEEGASPELILATDMLDLTTFLALTRARTAGTSTALYFHENQLSYPWSPGDRDVRQGRDIHYGFINYASALAADRVFFNSRYHLESFFEELPRMLRHFPDSHELDTVKVLRGKSAVLPLGLALRRLDAHRPGQAMRREKSGPPVILWNHRWEYDKNPEKFFRAVEAVADMGIDFRLVVLGECFSQHPRAFIRARKTLGARMLHMGYVEDFADYARWLWRADVLPVTSQHDFFGASVVEAVYCGCFPLLPRRLSYPELIPREHHGGCFYEDFDDLVTRLTRILREGPEAGSAAVQTAMRRFDWSAMGPAYDRALEAVVSGVPHPGG